MTARGDEPEGWDPTRPLADADADAESRGETGAEEGGAGVARGSSGGAGPPVLLPHLERLAALATRASGLEEGAARYARWVVETLRAGGKLLMCGNGGSAATAEHVAAENLVRFDRARRPLPAVALTGAGAVTSAAANDFSWEEVFERPLRALASPGDLVVLHSTTGESENVLRAARAASGAGIRTVALLAAGGGRVAAEVDLALVVPTDEPARAQELHLAIEHAVADRVDAAFAGEAP